MNKLLEFGRRTMFYIRVLTGYEERRIRAMRLQIENRIKQAEERKEAIRRLPEQTILSEVRRMVEGMQNLNKRLEETETVIEEYFKPLDKDAERLMKLQLEGEEKTMKHMLQAMKEQALRQQAEALKNAEVHSQGAKTSNQESERSTPQQTT